MSTAAPLNPSANPSGSAHPLVCRWRTCRHAMSYLGVTVGLWTGLSFTAPATQALEAVQLTYGELESEPIPLADLEAFAFSGIPSQDMRILLDILRIDEALAQEFLTREIPLDLQSIRETSETFIGATFWRLVGTAISMTDTTGLAWEHLRDALLNAAADDRVTLLEVLQNVEAGLLIIDTQRLSALSSLVRQDANEIQPFSILGHPQESAATAR